jgi:hypothetical protein
MNGHSQPTLFYVYYVGEPMATQLNSAKTRLKGRLFDIPKHFFKEWLFLEPFWPNRHYKAYLAVLVPISVWY